MINMRSKQENKNKQSSKSNLADSNFIGCMRQVPALGTSWITNVA